MGTRNDDISLKLAKAVKAGFLPDVLDSEIDILTRESTELFGNDETLSTKDRLKLARLNHLTISDQLKSAADSRIAYEDSLSFIETWANLTNWSSSTFSQVSGNRLYATEGSAGANSGANKSFALNADEKLRAVFKLRTESNTATGGVIVGVSSDSPGGAAPAGVINTRGIYFHGPTIKGYFDGTTTTLGNVPIGTKNWIITLVVDLSWVTITAVCEEDTTLEFRVRHVRGVVNNLTVFNSDTRGLAGHSLGTFGARKSISTVAPRTGIEGVKTTVWSGSATANVRIQLPANYDSRRPSPAIMLFHGQGSSETHFVVNAQSKAVADAFVNAGYIAISAAFNSNTATWGAQGSLDAYYEAYLYAKSNFAVGPIVFYANSMGGIESLLTVAERRIPTCAWIGTVPSANLKDNYNNPAFTSNIKTAYGIASDGKDYDEKTIGHDPALMTASAFRGIPMYAVVATDDTAVLTKGNWDVFRPIVESHSADFQTVYATGGHQTAAITANIANYLAFANKHISL